MSPLLKLFQDKVTFQSQERGVEEKGVRQPEPKAEGGGEGEGERGRGEAGCVACIREVVCSCLCVYVRSCLPQHAGLHHHSHT